VTKKEADKFLNCKDLTIRIHCIWNVTTTVTPIIIESTGTLSNSLRNYLRNEPGKHDVPEPNKTATLSTAHTHTAESTGVQFNGFVVGNNITCAIYCNYRTAATLYSVGTWFVSGI
jgi:hypothetical protein